MKAFINNDVVEISQIWEVNGYWYCSIEKPITINTKEFDTFDVVNKGNDDEDMDMNFSFFNSAFLIGE